jgi:hypothetical protein
MSKLFLISEEEKNRILNLHESATSRQYLSEQQEIKKGSMGDPYDYMKKNGKYFFRNVRNNETKWTSANEKQSNVIKEKIFNIKPVGSKTVTSPPKNTKPKNSGKTVQKQYCEAFPKTSDVNSSLIPQYQSEAGNLISLGIPKRTACEISFIKIRPKFNGKPFFVVDTLQNLIYLFDSHGKFVVKSQTLDGENAQSQDVKKIAQALWTWQQQVESMGFKWDPSKQKYLDKTSKNRTYDSELVYNKIDKNDTRFFPKGIYSISGLKTDDDYIGGNNNIFSLQTLDGKQIAQAIHGFYNESPRVAALEQLKKSMGSSASSPKVSQEFLNLVEKYVNTSKFNKSYGCINVPSDFLKKARPYAKKGTLVFVIGETSKNFLVQNSDNFFNKMGNGQQCANPASLGIELPQIEGVA